MYEKLYLIHNPLDGIKIGFQKENLQLDLKSLRNVFGVLYLNDVKIMLHYNNPFKESIMKEYNITAEEKYFLTSCVSND